MKVLVPIKRVVDYHVRVRVNREQTDVDKNNVKMSMNPFDEIALEAALQLKEQGVASEICVVSIGDTSVQETLRHGLAMGADSAIQINADSACESLTIASVLKQVAEQQQAELVLLGKQAIDDDCNQVGQMLAGLLDWPQATFASHIVCVENAFTVTREVDGGLETVLITKPAVITADLRLNTPRFVSLPNIMKAKSKPLDIVELNSFDLPQEARITTLKVESPPTRKAGIKVANFDELMQKLQEDNLL